MKGTRTVRRTDRPPLVGRKQDLLQLALLQARALEERRPQLVSIVAPAGTGKTRLLEEFLQRLDPADGFQVATVRCLPYGQTLTYWPLRGLLIGLLGEEITKAAVISVFTRGGYKLEDASRLADFVLATLGIEGERTTDRECIFGAWRLLIEVLAQEDFVTLRAEAQQLAEATGNQDELWRVRLIDLFCHPHMTDFLPEEANEGRHIGLAAAAYFEQRGDWVAFSEALDGYAGLSLQIGAFSDALVALRRRVAAPKLPAIERGDALQMIAKAYRCLGDYENCMATIQEVEAALREESKL